MTLEKVSTCTDIRMAATKGVEQTKNNMAEKTKKELLQAAQNETNLVVAEKRIEVLKALVELDEIKATDDYKVTIQEALKAFNTPLPLAFLCQVLPDSTLLLEARKALREMQGDGKDQPPIIEEFKDAKDKTKIILRLLKAA